MVIGLIGHGRLEAMRMVRGACRCEPEVAGVESVDDVEEEGLGLGSWHEGLEIEVEK